MSDFILILLSENACQFELKKTIAGKREKIESKPI